MLLQKTCSWFKNRHNHTESPLDYYGRRRDLQREIQQQSAYLTYTLGCIILPKVIGFIDSPLNPIIWTTNSSPSEKFLKNFHKQGPPLRRLGYVYAVLSKALPRKSFC